MPKLIDFTALNEMLFGEKKYIMEFSQAAIESFTEYSVHYTEYLVNRDETNLRKAGHKIKPVAQMLGLDQLIEEYEAAKLMLLEEAPEQDLIDSTKKVQEVIDQVKAELREIIEQP